MKKFKEIREEAFKIWLSKLNRSRQPGELSDTYNESYICKWQNELLEQGEHCSVLCSVADWLDNVSDQLDDTRYDELTNDDNEILFRYYTRILLTLSEIIEDFIMLHVIIKGYNPRKEKSVASRELENKSEILQDQELKELSNFINSVCKHKSEHHNYHIHNHHLNHEFADFGAKEHDNQIRLGQSDWKKINDQTILFRPLNYYLGIVIQLYLLFDQLLENEQGYKEELFKRFSKEWNLEDTQN